MPTLISCVSDLGDCSSDYESALSDIEDLRPAVYSFGLRNQKGPYHDETGFDDGEEFIPIEDDDSDESDCTFTSDAKDLDVLHIDTSILVTSTGENIAGDCHDGAPVAADDVGIDGVIASASSAEATGCTDLGVLLCMAVRDLC